MKIINFLINSNILIGIAAVSLTIATFKQLGLPVENEVLFALVFCATLFDYNLHSYLKIKQNPKAYISAKNKWTADNILLVKLLIFISLAGIIISLFFVRTSVFLLILALAFPTMLYSIIITGRKNFFEIKGIIGIKILLLSITWSSVTIYAPLLQSGNEVNRMNTFLVFIERFSFIFAIAIPFDIRDIKADILAGIKTIPSVYGEKQALLVSNIVMTISLLVAIIHYNSQNMNFMTPAYSTSVIVSLLLINNKSLKRLPGYYHGILDGSIILHGLLLCLSFYFR